MSFIVNLRLSHRLTLGFGLVLALLVAVAALSLQRIRGLSDTLDEVVLHGAERSDALTALERRSTAFMFAMRDMPGGELAEGKAMMDRARTAWQAYLAADDTVRGLLQSGDQEAVTQLDLARQQAMAVHEILLKGEKDAGGRGDTAAFFAVRELISGKQANWIAGQKDWTTALVALADWDQRLRKSASAQASASAQLAQLLVLVGTLLGLAVGGITAWWITRDLTQGIGRAVEATERMAQHDLSVPTPVNRGDELGLLAAALERMRQAQHALAAGVRQACTDIATASAEIAQGSQDLSGRTEQAAITVQRAIGSIDELTGSVEHAAQSAGNANGLAGETQGVASKGGTVVAEAVATMDQIDQASRRIADITAMIDGIAFQTNILALNAAVEAARAGEQGRGFAVVAAEVRTLAQRSATAAREIKALIEDSLHKVATGSGQVRRAGGATGEIVDAVKRVSALIAEIGDATGHQRHGIGQTRHAVQELDQVSQQNAALAEESAAAAGSLQQQAQRLTQLVSRFRLEAGHAV
jgi:methyl-accepting chemotaxis protein